VDLLGGEISVESILGEGSIFRIRLAYELDPDRENEDKQKSASVCLKKIRVLILEKNATSSNLLKEYLNSFGMQADFSVTEEEAVKMLKETGRYKQPYDLFILDNDTPESGGIEFASRIKNDRQIVVKPRIMLMIPLMREDLFERIEEADVDFGISKPIIASILYNSIIEVFKDQVLAGMTNRPKMNRFRTYWWTILIMFLL
jgi:CheY-like chemotaxis protein